MVKLAGEIQELRSVLIVDQMLYSKQSPAENAATNNRGERVKFIQ